MKIGKHIVNPRAIARANVSEGTTTWLNVYMVDGSHFTVTHHPIGLEPVNVYELLRTIEGYLRDAS